MTNNKNRRVRRRIGTVVTAAGTVLMLAACVVYAYARWDDHRAAASAGAALLAIETRLSEDEAPAPTVSSAGAFTPDEPEEADAAPAYTETTIEIDGVCYLGTIRFPRRGLALPVIADWAFDSLRLAPVRYAGSVATDDLVIAGHNYSTHFSVLHQVETDEEIVFTDAAGREIRYVVRMTEVLEPTAVEEMVSGDWDLTLFTCTYGGKTRRAVRCERVTEF